MFHTPALIAFLDTELNRLGHSTEFNEKTLQSAEDLLKDKAAGTKHLNVTNEVIPPGLLV